MLKKIVTGAFQTNTYLLVQEKECILIDPGLDFESIARQLQKEYQVKAIIITHGHMDHIDGIQYFDVPVYFPKLDQDFLLDETLSLYRFFGGHLPFDVNQLNLIYVEDGMEFDLLGYHFKAIATPGHTKGSMCYVCGNNLFSGDTLFQMGVGRTDFPTGDAKTLKQSIAKLYQLCDEKMNVYPGHGPETTLDREKAYHSI